MLNGYVLVGYVWNGYVWIRIAWIRVGGKRVERIRIGGYASHGYVLVRYVFNGYVLVGYVWNGYVWDVCGVMDMCGDIRQQSSEEPCDETSFGNYIKKMKRHQACIYSKQ